MRLNTSRIASRLSRKTPRIRILRSWRGYPVGAVIQPPGGARQILLQAKDPLGNKVAELVEDDPVIVERIPEKPVENKVAEIIKGMLRLPGKRK